MKYEKHDLAGLKKVYNGKWDSFETVEDEFIQKRLVLVKKLVVEIAKALKTDWIYTEDKAFVIRIPSKTVLNGYPRALLDAIIAEADGISFCSDCGELAMVVTVDSVLQIYDGKRI